MTHTGKIHRLPAALREELDRRLHDGHPFRDVLAASPTTSQTESLHAEPQVISEESLPNSNDSCPAR
jgi:hypothetical protein